jgi:hypothetical protein
MRLSLRLLGDHDRQEQTPSSAYTAGRESPYFSPDSSSRNWSHSNPASARFADAPNTVLAPTRGAEPNLPCAVRDEDLLLQAEVWKRTGLGVALATVIETWDAAPRVTGSNLVVNDEGVFLGSVSGGCIESAVVADALHVIASGKPEVLEFGVADDTARSVGLTGGGSIQIFIEKVD